MNPLRSITRALGLGGAGRRSALGVGAVPAAPVLSGTYITPQTALGLTSVFAAINVVSRDTATLPLGVSEWTDGGGLRPAPGFPTHDLLAVSPDGETDAFRFRRDVMGHVLGWGNGYAEIVRSKGAAGDGSPLRLQLRHPSRTKPKRDPDGRLYYELDDGKRKRNVLAEDMLHFAGLGFNGLQGYSPITVARQSLGVALAAEQFGASFFGNGAIHRGILKLKKRLGVDALANLRQSVNEVHQGSANAHQFMVLEEGMDWQQTSVPPEEAQFLQTRQFQVLEVARLFGVPPHKIGDYSQAHLSSVEQANLDYMVTTLAGWVAMLEAQLNWKLLTAADRRRYVIRHDFSALLRGDSAARVAYYQGLRNMGAVSADEIRVREGMVPLGPKKGGDLYLVQSQYTRLDQAGRPSEPGAKRRAASALKLRRGRPRRRCFDMGQAA